MCIDCYRQSDVFLEVCGHYHKNYKRMKVIDSFGNNVLLLSSLEIKYFQYLSNNHIKWMKPPAIKYTDNIGKTHIYFADFYLVDTNETIEVKGYWWNNDKQKMKWVIEQHPELNIKILTRKDI